MSDYHIKSRIWIQTKDHVLLGEGRVALLKAIIKEGSLSKAAVKLNMSYKKAWDLMNAVNSAAKETVVTKTIGGKKGGGTVVTPYGVKLIEVFDTINKNCWEFLDDQLAQFDL